MKTVIKIQNERSYPWVGSHLGVNDKYAIVVIFTEPGKGLCIQGDSTLFGTIQEFTEREYKPCSITLSN